MEMINEFDLKHPKHSHLTQEVYRWKLKYEEVKEMLITMIDIYKDATIDIFEDCYPIPDEIVLWLKKVKENKDGQSNT